MRRIALLVPLVAARGKGETHTVCKRGCDHRTIQAAVNDAKAGDSIRVRNGTYREGVRIKGARKSYLKLIGNPKSPKRVTLDAKGLKGSGAQNAFSVDGADGVTINGFAACNQKANGFFIANAVDYTLTNLNAQLTGTYGIYAFNTVGGRMTNSEASYNNDAGFYIGPTPLQAKPRRSIVRNVRSWGNVLGFSGTNMRYVTITKSLWFNNGLGIVPNALDSEKFPPEEFNVITDNDIFWNNFNYFAGAPFPLRAGATGDIPYPVGTGVLLFGGRGNVVENNRIYGNYLVGVGMIQQILLKQADAKDLRDNVVRNNRFGLDGTDKNGRDLFYDGNGTGNCFAGNVGVEVTVPANGLTFAPCPFTGANAFSEPAQGEAVNWTVGDPTHEKFWVRNPHAPKAGFTPLEHFEK